jgi:anti-anti-sigma factor
LSAATFDRAERMISVSSSSLDVEHFLPAAEASWPLSSAADGVRRRGQKAHATKLVLGPGKADVQLAGDIDLSAAADVTRLMESLDVLDMPIHVDLSEVRFMDSAGLQPLVEATRRRRMQDKRPVVIGVCSRPVLRLLDAGGVGASPSLDVEAWDRLG